jgi:hypothetical protein
MSETLNGQLDVRYVPEADISRFSSSSSAPILVGTVIETDGCDLPFLHPN